MDDAIAVLVLILMLALGVGGIVYISTSNNVLIDGMGVASDLSPEQMYDIAEYIEEKYPANFNYRSEFAQGICCNCKGVP